MRRYRTVALLGLLMALASLAYGQLRFDLTVSTSRTITDDGIEFFVILESTGVPPQRAIASVNIFEFFFRQGTQIQARRAVDCVFVPLDPLGNPTFPIIQIAPNQLPSGAQARIFPTDPLGISVVIPDPVGEPTTREALIVSRATRIDLDQNGNPTQRTGNLEITITDRRAPEETDTYRLFYYEGPRNNPTFSLEFEGTPINDGQLFVHRRVVR
ncbi:MAG: hypothetical protein NZ874_05810 [Fimbriimonadales bacterium]|nr:hypothetical protein [Fimbriimonadales bacterium]